MPDLSVIVPTYCEALNLPELVSRIDAATRGAGIDAEILVVDDNSPDETRAVCRRVVRQVSAAADCPHDRARIGQRRGRRHEPG